MNDDGSPKPNIHQAVFEKVTQYESGTQDLQAEIDRVRALLEQSPDNSDFKEWLAFKLYCNNQFGDAIQLYKDLLRAGIDNDSIRFYLGNSYYKLGDIEMALPHWRWIVEKAPHSRRARKATARIKRAELELASGRGTRVRP